MPVSPTSYESQVAAAVVNMLAASTTFQGLAGAADATAARAAIVEDDAGLMVAPKACDGQALNPTTTYAIVRPGPLQRTDRAAQTYGAEGEVAVLIVATRLANESDSDALRRARNAQGLIRAEIEALYGTTVNAAPALVAGRVTCAPPEICDETGALRGRIYIFLDLAWRDIP